MSKQVVECLLAQNACEREDVYRLRYSCYRRKESISVREDERFTDAFDEKPNSFSFLLRSAGADALATVRISVVNAVRGWTDSPVRHVYGDAPELQAIEQESFVEASRLCFGAQARRDVLVALLGNMAALADVFSVKWLVACPRVEHAGMYQRLFGFVPLAPPRQYFGVNFETQLLAIRTEDLRAHVQSEKPMLAAWESALIRLSACPQFGPV